MCSFPRYPFTFSREIVIASRNTGFQASSDHNFLVNPRIWHFAPVYTPMGKAINISVRAEFTTIGRADPVSGSFQNVGKHDNVDTLAAPEMMLTITSNPVDRQILKPFNNSIPAVIRMQFFD
jgi:hypothetical protein